MKNNIASFLILYSPRYFIISMLDQNFPWHTFDLYNYAIRIIWIFITNLLILIKIHQLFISLSIWRLKFCHPIAGQSCSVDFFYYLYLCLYRLSDMVKKELLEVCIMTIITNFITADDRQVEWPLSVSVAPRDLLMNLTNHRARILEHTVFNDKLRNHNFYYCDTFLYVCIIVKYYCITVCIFHEIILKNYSKKLLTTVFQRNFFLFPTVHLVKY